MPRNFKILSAYLITTLSTHKTRRWRY